jgi:hypothetical protein
MPTSEDTPLSLHYGSRRQGFAQLLPSGCLSRHPGGGPGIMFIITFHDGSRDWTAPPDGCLSHRSGGAIPDHGGTASARLLQLARECQEPHGCLTAVWGRDTSS